ncbi:MAG: C4-dicarboxylate ABC transporter substrate-binding protein, partial [Syntrophaceae bacterium]|nr:C4-dicarboxylate ABC transporter substrate-binding protein [Syntrophaceae bacterium]
PAAYTTTFFVVMNKEKWSSLPDDVKQIILKVNEEWIPKHIAAWGESDNEGMAFLKEKNKEIIELDEAEQVKWKQAVQPVLSEFVLEMKAKNLPGQEALDIAKKALESNK